MAGFGVPAGFILMYCPGLAAVLLAEKNVRNGMSMVSVQGETYKCTKAVRQQLNAGDTLLIQGPGK